MAEFVGHGAFFLLLVLCSGCGSPASPTEKNQKIVLNIGVPEGTVTNGQLGVRQSANMLALEGLTQVNADGRVVPRLAEGWRWDDDGRTLRVFLRKGVSFHNGKPLDASIAVDVLRGIVARPGNRALYPALADVTSIDAVGPLELTFQLDRPSAFLPEDLSVPLALEGDGVGTGPYRVAKRDKSVVILDRNDRYYLGKPAIAQVVIRPFDALRTTWTSLLRGDLDMVMEVPPESAEFIQNADVQTLSFPHWYQFILAFNLTRKPFDEPVVRRALNLAIDRDALIKKTLKGSGTVATGPLWPKHWAYDTSIQGFSFDPTTATALLDSAGLKKSAASSADGFPGARLRFTCLIPTKFSLLERLALDLQRQLYEIGVDMQFEAVPIAEYDTRIRDGKFEAVLVDMISGPTLGRPYIFWRSGKSYKGLNVFGYENQEAERLFDVLRTSAGEAAVRSATSRLQRVLLDDPPAVFLAWNQRTRLVRREFHVYQELGRDPIPFLWRWTANPHAVETASVQ